jgi:hypothetical protein
MAKMGVLFSLTMLASVALAQIPEASGITSPEAKVSSDQIAAHGTLVAELAKPIDARKAKADSRVEVRLTMDLLSHGEIVIPRGTKIIGYIIGSKTPGKEIRGSEVEITFDRIVLKNRREIPLKATIQAVGAPAVARVPSTESVSDLGLASQTQSRPAPGPNEMRSIAEATYPGSRHPANSAVGTGEPRSSGPNGSPTQLLGPASQGVFGMKGVVLRGTAYGSAITSSSGDLHLKNGTQLVLRILDSSALADFLGRTKN